MYIKRKLIIFAMFVFSQIRCQIPIIYHEDYNIKLMIYWGIWRCLVMLTFHCITERYRKIFDFLKANGVDEECLTVPSPVTDCRLGLSLFEIISLQN